MSFLRHRSSINYTYSINGLSVTSVGSEKDLGRVEYTVIGTLSRNAFSMNRGIKNNYDTITKNVCIPNVLIINLLKG